jgi:hypothetical protein
MAKITAIGGNKYAGVFGFAPMSVLTNAQPLGTRMVLRLKVE